MSRRKRKPTIEWNPPDSESSQLMVGGVARACTSRMGPWVRWSAFHADYPRTDESRDGLAWSVEDARKAAEDAVAEMDAKS